MALAIDADLRIVVHMARASHVSPAAREDIGIEGPRCLNHEVLLCNVRAVQVALPSGCAIVRENEKVAARIHNALLVATRHVEASAATQARGLGGAVRPDAHSMVRALRGIGKVGAQGAAVANVGFVRIHGVGQIVYALGGSPQLAEAVRFLEDEAPAHGRVQARLVALVACVARGGGEPNVRPSHEALVSVAQAAEDRVVRRARGVRGLRGRLGIYDLRRVQIFHPAYAVLALALSHVASDSIRDVVDGLAAGRPPVKVEALTRLVLVLTTDLAAVVRVHATEWAKIASESDTRGGCLASPPVAEARIAGRGALVIGKPVLAGIATLPPGNALYRTHGTGV